MTAPFSFEFQDDSPLGGGGGGGGGTPTPTPTPTVDIYCTGPGDCPAGYTCEPFAADFGICKAPDVPPSSCPPKGTLIQCLGDENSQLAILSTGLLVDGICTTEQGLSTECIKCKPAGTLFVCNQGAGVYYTGEKDEFGVCVFTRIENDPECNPCPTSGTRVNPNECYNDVGGILVYNGTRDQNGTCATRVDFDPTCVKCPEKDTHLGCSGSFGIKSQGFANTLGICATYRVENDVECAPPDIECYCYTVRGKFSSTNQRATFTTRYTDCKTGEVVTLTDDGETNVCSRTLPTINDGTIVATNVNCTNDENICGEPTPPGPDEPPPPDEPPAPQISLTPSVTPSLTPSISATPGQTPTVTPSITPSISDTPIPTPTPSPVYWRSCIDGNQREGIAPSDYIEQKYPKGGTCWEPKSQVGFEPMLSEALQFYYARGSSFYPETKTVIATNPSYVVSYEVKLLTNNEINITPNVFILGPRANKSFTVKITPSLLEKLGDGISDMSLNIEVRQV